MSPTEFECLVAEIMSKYNGGYWTLRIPKNNRGAQPFDILAIGKVNMYAIDCKVCAKHLFPLSRIEDNQWLAMEMLSQKRDDVIVGFFCFFDGDIFFVPFSMAKEARDSGQKSISLRRLKYKYVDMRKLKRFYGYLFMRYDEVCRIVGREV